MRVNYYFRIIINLLRVGVWNVPAVVELEDENTDLFNDLNRELEIKLGYGFNMHVLEQISINLLLRTHDKSEILELLEEFKQLRGEI